MDADFNSSKKEPKLFVSSQHDGLRTTMKKGTPKILSKSISRVPMGAQLDLS